MSLLPYTKTLSLLLLLVSIYTYYYWWYNYYTSLFIYNKYNYVQNECYIHPTEKKVEELLTLEAMYGLISGYEPAINDVIKYLSKVYTCTADFILSSYNII